MKKIQKKQKIKKSKDQKIIQEKIIRNIDKRVQKQKNRNNKKIKKKSQHGCGKWAPKPHLTPYLGCK